MKNFLSSGRSELLDQGGNAEIFIEKEGPYSKFCVKVGKKNPQIVCNDIEKEMDYQSIN